jgi:hypothetical protein
MRAATTKIGFRRRRIDGLQFAADVNQRPLRNRSINRRIAWPR